MVEDKRNPAKLGISFSYGRSLAYYYYEILLNLLKFNSRMSYFILCAVLPYTPYWILSTDYDNSALVYSCTDVLRLFHVDFAWILSRTRSLPAATIDHGKEVFMNNNIDVSRMILSRQQGCD